MPLKNPFRESENSPTNSQNVSLVLRKETHWFLYTHIHKMCIFFIWGLKPPSFQLYDKKPSAYCHLTTNSNTQKHVLLLSLSHRSHFWTHFIKTEKTECQDLK